MNAKAINAKAVSTTKRDDSLKTKYFCEVNGLKDVCVVMQITTRDASKTRRLPLRFVLVIDVSGSMDSTVGSESLLDRVKLFAELVIQNVCESDSLAIVSFSSDVEIDLPMTKMEVTEKEKAKRIVEGLHTRGQTNLEIGLITGLNVIKNSPSDKSRDCIILFTDGGANKGETNPEELVKKYWQLEKSLNKKSCVPLSALTIGNYFPHLLIELADHLGSDAFYWLNENVDFESDMLIPVFLRESTEVTDVSIEMSSLLGVTFDQTNVDKHSEFSSEKKMKYFIQAIPASMKKHLMINLKLPDDTSEDMNGKQIMEIKVTYLDEKLIWREINDFVILSTKTVRECRGKRVGSLPKSNLMDGTSAFVIDKNRMDSTWMGVQNSLKVVGMEYMRKTSILALYNAQVEVIQEKPKEAIHQAKQEITRVKMTYEILLGDINEHTRELKKFADDWTSKLDFANQIANMQNIGRLFAMRSSTVTEMPTAKGVFGKGKQPYLPPQVDQKLQHYKKLVETKRKVRKQKKSPEFEITRVFKGKYFLVSESFRDKRIGTKQETISELIIKCGGTPVPNVRTMYNDTFLVCSRGDYKKKTILVKDSEIAKIPIVSEKYIYDCIRSKSVLELDKYIMKKT